jgi:hypothetical protein
VDDGLEEDIGDEIERHSLTDAEIHRAVATTVRDVLLPALRDEADWARAVAIQLVGLARYGAERSGDQTASRIAELAGVLDALAGNELVDEAWNGDRSQRAVMGAAGAILAAAVGRDDDAARAAVGGLRPVLLRQLDDELAETARLVDAFRGRLDG